ncbi:hypothetical protein EV191_12631 [Tamaricihabitans halophyticus]|uniref:Uncharacterized protein n=1 Tax=Tamaricihabitans halophyticus TaxID=1262583 RepID=A0A4R2Q3M0_9PSEU|nr:hypothetical protein EV191_12631 [Tamaricihabitans halophyticus]
MIRIERQGSGLRRIVDAVTVGGASLLALNH